MQSCHLNRVMLVLGLLGLHLCVLTWEPVLRWFKRAYGTPTVVVISVDPHAYYAWTAQQGARLQEHTLQQEGYCIHPPEASMRAARVAEISLFHFVFS